MGMVCHIIVVYDFFFVMIRRPPRSTRTDTPVPTRRSSDLHRHRHRRDARRGDGGSRPLPGAAGHVIHRQRALLGALAQVGDRLFDPRSEEHTSELQSLMRISYAVFCLKKKTNNTDIKTIKPSAD